MFCAVSEQTGLQAAVSEHSMPSGQLALFSQGAPRAQVPGSAFCGSHDDAHEQPEPSVPQFQTDGLEG